MAIYIEINGMDDVISRMSALPKEVERAKRNAINAVAATTRREIIKTLSTKLGIKAKWVRPCIMLRRYDPRRPYALVKSLGTRLPLSVFRTEIAAADATGTRARILVHDRIGGNPSVAWGFVNPQGLRHYPLDRIQNKRSDKRGARGALAVVDGKQLLTGAPGRSLKGAFSDINTDSYRVDIATALAAAFEEKLSDQIRKRRT